MTSKFWVKLGWPGPPGLPDLKHMKMELVQVYLFN
jgi:hypothetical protein